MISNKYNWILEILKKEAFLVERSFNQEHIGIKEYDAAQQVLQSLIEKVRQEQKTTLVQKLLNKIKQLNV